MWNDRDVEEQQFIPDHMGKQHMLVIPRENGTADQLHQHHLHHLHHQPHQQHQQHHHQDRLDATLDHLESNHLMGHTGASDIVDPILAHMSDQVRLENGMCSGICKYLCVCVCVFGSLPMNTIQTRV